MRIPILIASAAALALASCGGNGPGDRANNGQAAAAEPQVDDKSLEEEVMAALEDAPKHGLTKDLFLKGELPSDKAQRRKALLGAAADFASALADGKTDPAKLSDVYTVPRPKVDVRAGLASALQDGRFREWVNSLAPQTAEYRALSGAFVKLVQRSPDLPDGNIPGGRAIELGDADPRVPAITRNLIQLGYLPPEIPVGRSYTQAISQAVARFQSDSGLKSDGTIGNSTLVALNGSPRDRARTLAVAMERLRWLEREPPATRIDVNTAAALLDYWRDGQPKGRRNVVVGQPDWATPQLGAPIFQLVANPSWNVPKSIEEKELSKKPALYFAEQNIVRKDGRYVQLPGPKNALGQVKFDMKDDQAIYLHDTPAKALFGQPERHESHGCVRVEGALDLAAELAAADGVLPKFQEALMSGEETFVKLRTPIPVRLMYHTAFLGTDGRVHFAEDVYGWDNDVAAALGYERKAPSRLKVRTGDVGP